MTSTGVIAFHTFRSCWQRRLLAILIGALVLSIWLGVQQADELAFAQRAGDLSAAARARLNLVTDSVDTLALAAAGVALFLGSTVLADDLRSRRALLVLSLPVSRTAYGAGKACGALSFVLLLCALAGCVGLLMASYLSLPTTGLFWLGLARIASVGFVLFCVSFGVSSVCRPAVAAVVAVLLVGLSTDSQGLLRHSWWPVRWLSTALWFLGPVPVPGDPLREGLVLEPASGHYAMGAAALALNGVFGLAFLLAGLGLLERKRELWRE